MFILNYFVSATGLLVLILVAILSACYYYFQTCYSYWTKKGVPNIAPNFPVGNLGGSLLGSENLFIRIQNLYNVFRERGCKHAGIYFFNGPVYMPIDAEIVKRILISDFEYFTDRGTHHDEHNFPLSASILSMRGEYWKDLRTKLTPTFTSNKIKSMYATMFMKYTENLMQKLEPIARSRSEFSSKRYLSLFAADIIASSALGFEFNVLDNPDQEITTIIDQLICRPFWVKLKSFLTVGYARPGNLFKSLHDNTEARDWFEKAVKQTIKFRNDNNITNKDFFSSLMDIEGVTWNQLVGQVFLFFAAGYDTTSTMMCNCLHQLAYNPEVQVRLRDEIHKNLGSDFRKFSYEGLTQLAYLENVLKETARIFPPIAVLLRDCVKDYPVPGTDVVVDKGTPVILSILGSHRDPENFPDPLRFNPDRFENGCPPYSILTFGEGPRNCIGMRYGLLKVKLAIAAIVSEYRILPSPKTPRDPEFEKIPSAGVLQMKSGMYIRLEML